jgi:hypothetical protein
MNLELDFGFDDFDNVCLRKQRNLIEIMLKENSNLKQESYELGI